ncbi:hypothetical protein [Maribacter luteus]|uniref:Uncharacterized protein n=1 Tax=Maribacter luteus TaxID=2594478 RepID=A0A6I2MRM1_9FLAO|nr:hypothetical protein [Maribacter luteus]MRX65080.1 hypothetical protein [Maribacter luteus]
MVSIMIIPLVLGIVFENRRLSSNWKRIALIISSALLLSTFAFIPSKGEDDYSFEHHIEMWPYFFIFIFVIISMAYHEKKIIPQLTEGITLLQSISIIYWIMDIGFLDKTSTLTYILIVIGLFFCIVSFIHAFTYLNLTRSSRLFLSIWSSLIMILFGIDHIYRVYKFTYFIDYKMLNDALNILQYFLLGVSLMYIFQNFYMLFPYLPDKYRPYGKDQMKDIRDTNKMHIKRYSREQIKKTDSFLALIFSGGIYYANYSYHIMPRHTAIWLVFWIFPTFLWIKAVIFTKTLKPIN